MNCISGALELFKTNSCAAWTIAIVAFVLGVVVMCAICRIFRPCGKNNNGSCGYSKKQGQRRQDRGEPKFEKTHPAPADGSIEIYVGNLSYDLTEEQLRKEFEAFGKVTYARIITNRYNGRSKGFGFVHMPNRAEVDAAVKALSDKEILGRKLKCNEAKNVG
jgi:RNA recognition motif-containing protein